ncbi:siphovirus ReqiPepy6 Gp37-like family protein [Streptomyces sp. NPDC048644]|uniref:siphovirus ReqiPepy6 Gp37-like family protein n=1 Tax=Streptomyces sp. NPDC048644 TaxID=3365582 RepID=UPI003722B327
MGYRILVRGNVDNDERRILGEIDTWVRLDFTVRFNQPGTWQLLVKSGTYQEGLLTMGRGIVIYQDGVPDPVFSGQIDAFERYWTVDQHTDTGSVFVGGRCDNQVPYGYVAFPGIAGSGAEQITVLPVEKQYTGKGTRAAGGPAGQAIWVEADLAFGSRALSDRKIGGLTVGPNVPIGDTFSDSLRFDNLGEKFEEWLTDKRVGYRFVWSYTTKQIEMSLYECRDRSGEVRFSPDLGNLRQYTWQLKAPTATRALVACQGEGAERYLWQKVDRDGETQWGVKREVFVDRRDIPLKTGKDGKPELVTKIVKGESGKDIEEIGLGPDGEEWPGATLAEKKAAATAHYMKAVGEAAAHALKEGEKSGHFQIYPIDTPQCTFGRDYFVGDIVTVAVDGEEYQDIVKEVNISVEDGGRISDVTPKIGDQGTGEPLNIYKTVWDMKAKLRKLESRM